MATVHDISHDKKPLVSVIIPALNEEKYLEACLKSVLSQEGSVPYEVIVVDNGSEDGTAQIAKKYPVKFIFEPRRGLTRARQTGFEEARGKIVAYIDADSVAPHDWVVSIKNAFDQHPDTIALRGYYRFLVKSKFHKLIFWFYFNFLEKIIDVVFKGRILAGANFAVLRDTLKAIGGFNLNVVFYGEDVELASRLRKAGRISPLHCTVLSSGRRFDSRGVLIPGFTYLFNYVWVMVFDRPIFNFYDTPEENSELAQTEIPHPFQESLKKEVRL